MKRNIQIPSYWSYFWNKFFI